MERTQEQRTFQILLILSVIVLAISVWAFIQNVHMTTGDIQQKSMNGTSASGAKEPAAAGDVLDTDVLAQTVLKEVSFDTKLAKADDTVTQSMVTAQSEDTKVSLYMGEGTCADELMILEAADEEHAKDEVATVQSHLGAMQQSFQDYLPKEAKKIDDAVILQKGKYIIACVTADAANAKKVIEEQLK